MNSPTGLVTSRTRPKNTRICRMPLLVIAASKPLGLEHRPPEVDEEEHRHHAGNDVLEHGQPSYTRSNALVIAQSARNPTIPITRYNRSSMRFLLVFGCVDEHH